MPTNVIYLTQEQVKEYVANFFGPPDNRDPILTDEEIYLKVRKGVKDKIKNRDARNRISKIIFSEIKYCESEIKSTHRG